MKEVKNKIEKVINDSQHNLQYDLFHYNNFDSTGKEEIILNIRSVKIEPKLLEKLLQIDTIQGVYNYSDDREKNIKIEYCKVKD